jgi:hypothetical protein
LTFIKKITASKAIIMVRFGGCKYTKIYNTISPEESCSCEINRKNLENEYKREE